MHINTSTIVMYTHSSGLYGLPAAHTKSVTREKKRKTHSNIFKTNCAYIAGRTELLSERLRVERL